MKNERELLVVADLVEILGRSVSSINKLIASGELPQPFKLGQIRHWDRRVLLDHLKAKQQAVLKK